MQPFTRLHGLVVPLDRANVDTDAIMPKQFMKTVRRTGFGDNLFDEWRYLDRGEPGQDVSQRPRNADFPLNQPRYAGAQVLLTRRNFGCGSSREHAAWALHDWGIRALIAPSFADIFHGNCFKNGMLPITLDDAVVERLFRLVDAQLGLRLDIDLGKQTVTADGAEPLPFDVDPSRRQRLLSGLDDIALTLQKTDRIRAYEARHRASEPWLYPTTGGARPPHPKER